MTFAYPAEKFVTARRILMLSSPADEAQGIATAFHECTLGLKSVRDEDLDVSATAWVGRLRELMGTPGLGDPSASSPWIAKAQALTEDQRVEVAVIIDELAAWFQERLADDA